MLSSRASSYKSLMLAAPGGPDFSGVAEQELAGEHLSQLAVNISLGCSTELKLPPQISQEIPFLAAVIFGGLPELPCLSASFSKCTRGSLDHCPVVANPLEKPHLGKTGPGFFQQGNILLKIIESKHTER